MGFDTCKWINLVLNTKAIASSWKTHPICTCEIRNLSSHVVLLILPTLLKHLDITVAVIFYILLTTFTTPLIHAYNKQSNNILKLATDDYLQAEKRDTKNKATFYSSMSLFL